MTISVLIVDDSAVVRQVVMDVLAHEREFRVLGAAADPIFAMEKMKQEWPDVLVLDIEMPRMDGLTFLRKIMAERPTPVVICSSLTEKGAEVTLQAMSAGAVSILTKPSIGVRNFLQESGDALVHAIREAAAAKGRLRKPAAPPNFIAEKIATPKLTADAILDKSPVPALGRTTERIVAIGISTGGVQALEQLLPALKPNCPGLVIVQHMPEKFTATFAARLNTMCHIEVKEAEANDRVQPGRALIAPGGKHMLVKRSGTQYFVDVVDGPLVSRHRPSVDVLFRSVAKFAGANATGVIMTGMGDDGARGLREMREAGAHTIAQDEKSCVVFGMPKEAIKLDAVERIVPLEQLAELLGR